MNLSEGAIIEVVVSSVEQFGILVELGGRTGVILETNVYWDHDDVHRRMRDEFKPGQRMHVKVLAITPEQFSASIKHLHPEQDPWFDPSILKNGTVHTGAVILMFDFGGALVRLKNGVDVFVRALRPETRPNDHVDVVITSVDTEKRKIEAKQV